MKMKTSELVGASLDWAVAKAVCPKCFSGNINPESGLMFWSEGWLSNGKPTESWYLMGWLIEDYRVEFRGVSDATIEAYSSALKRRTYASNHLTAVCRLIAMELGEEIDVPPVAWVYVDGKPQLLITGSSQ